MEPMDFLKLTQRIATAQEAVQDLRRRASADPRSEALMPDTLDELQGSLEALHVAEEELRQQNDQISETQAALEEERARYRDLFDYAPVGYLVTSLTGVVEDANRQAVQLLGIDKRFLRGKPLITYVLIDDHDVFRDYLRQVAAIEEPLNRALRIKARAGPTFDAELTAIAERGRDGTPVAVRWMLRDVSEQRRAEEAIRHREEHFRAIIENVNEVITLVSGDGAIRYASPALEGVLGHRVADRVGGRLVDLIHPEDQAVVAAAFNHGVLLPGYHAQREVRVRHADGSWRRMEVVARNLLNNPAVAGVLVVARDITDRRKLESQVVEISALEQSRMGQDLHDGVGQILTALGMFVGALENKLRAKALDAEAGEAAAIRDMAAQCMIETRRIARGLHPVNVTAAAGDLGHMLRDLCAASETLFGIACAVRTRAGGVHLDAEAAAHLYRIAQEAVHNAVKHGKASQVIMHVTATESGLTMVIEDDGVGLPPEAERSRGMGLDLMQYRANLLGAQLDLRATGGGTAVTLALTCPVSVTAEESQAQPAEG